MQIIRVLKEEKSNTLTAAASLFSWPLSSTSSSPGWHQYHQLVWERTSPKNSAFLGTFLRVLDKLIKTISGTMALFILNKTGRKKLILGGLFAISFALLLLFFGSQYYSNNAELFSVFLMVGFFLHVFCFSMSLGQLIGSIRPKSSSHHWSHYHYNKLAIFLTAHHIISHPSWTSWR